MTSQPNNYLKEFLAMSIKHLLSSPNGFLNKLEKGDVSAIKMLLDYIYKTTPKDTTKTHQENKEHINIEEMTYEEAFEHIKENISEEFSDS